VRIKKKEKQLNKKESYLVFKLSLTCEEASG
jgi:hypothetical protein